MWAHACPHAHRARIAILVHVLVHLAGSVRRDAPRLSVLDAVAAVAGAGAAAALFGGSLTLVESGRGGETEMVALLDRFLGWPVQALFLLVPGLHISLGVSAGALAATGRVSRVSAAHAVVGLAVGVAAPEPAACIGTTLHVIGLGMMARPLTGQPAAPAASRAPAAATPVQV